MRTPDQPTPIRELIAELAHTEDVLRGCRAASPTARHREARRRQAEIVGELRRRPTLVVDAVQPSVPL